MIGFKSTVIAAGGSTIWLASVISCLIGSADLLVAIVAVKSIPGALSTSGLFTHWIIKTMSTIESSLSSMLKLYPMH